MKFKKRTESYKNIATDIWELNCELTIYIYKSGAQNKYFVERFVEKNEPTLIEWSNVTENQYPFTVNADEELAEDFESFKALKEAKEYAIKYYETVSLKGDV